MKNLLLFTCLALGCCSCATILNPSHKAMTIYTPSPSKIIIKNRYQPSLGTQKGEVNVHLSMPFLNAFLQKPTQDGAKSGIGFLGLAFGLDYYHQNDQYLKLGFCTVSDFFSPLPAPVYIEGGRDYLNSAIGYLSNHHRIKRLDWGYGLSLAENKWAVDNYIDDPDNNPPQGSQRKRSVSGGLIFSGHYFTGPSFHIGLQYCPSLWRLYDNPGFRYEHVISVDFAWKIRL